MDLGKLGVWTWLDGFSGPEVAGFARRIEDLGYSALWIPEAVGRDPFSLIGYLAAQTDRLILATGIANIYARDPMATKAIWKTLSELAPGRFILGLGVSHQHLVSGQRGHAYEKPLSTMRDYLAAMEKALFMARQPEEDAPIVLGALRDGMLRLSATACQGAHPYLVPPAHTKRAREVMGPDALLCPEQMVLAETDPTKARAIARDALKMYIRLPNYQNNLKQFGFTDADFADGGSDRLVDAMVCWGEPEKIAAQVKAHLDAGADHVCVQAFRPDGVPGPDEALLERLVRMID
ncbi:MAG: TIGR03620 family F420-dependent LLM class oxidoreductase [Spirochaetaceae bacterium]|nr:TIGR03620 family F420-dependent LLM class oxidoreductase [Myxococcales bacterium]MCB9723564.1 TIGR03620 family F420-dependent LLM class oxidoreductase [Spirochaetaceae bacterium]HPG28115.1 TIGR03620 family F420-dependent LLM class oxidoreductase [Myxococcota bacterium]